MFAYFGAVPKLVVPDDLRSGVRRACRYDPVANPTYQEMAAHYGVGVLPTRSAKPRDKAKVETGVQIVERWILARLRNHTYFSLAELNDEVRRLLTELNDRPFQKLAGTRRSLFASVELPAMRPLPADGYVFVEWRHAVVNIDYHIAVDKHFYSVPHRLVRERVEVRLSASLLEVRHDGRRVAMHPQSHRPARPPSSPASSPSSTGTKLSETPPSPPPPSIASSTTLTTSPSRALPCVGRSPKHPRSRLPELPEIHPSVATLRSAQDLRLLPGHLPRNALATSIGPGWPLRWNPQGPETARPAVDQGPWHTSRKGFPERNTTLPTCATNF